eukprot:TRINITY_DN11556_c0_g2_i1.p1 TRINITY_DN11556_c0_g2~~TRINITY_DN11556_c0_g2_i1.p1  ORF type:complete len:573 (+),score=121.91 TRINITY_DN11556_c0_g2_i1:214-1932(+)
MSQPQNHLTLSNPSAPPSDTKISIPHLKKYCSNVRIRNCVEALPQVMVKENLSLKLHAHPTPVKCILLPSAQKSRHVSPLVKLTENPSITAPSSVKSTANPSTTQCNKASSVKLKSVCAFCKGRNFAGVIQEQLYNKYEASTQNTYNLNMINDIVLNTNTQLVVSFKEYLIYDDLTEFIKEFQYRPAAELKELIDYYDVSSKVFPNFVALEEKKFMFKNITRKQKAINRRYMQLTQPQTEVSRRLLTSKFLAEITRHCSRTMIGERTGLEELLEQFVQRDSLSTAQKSRCEGRKPKFITARPKVKEEQVKSPRKLVVMAKNFLGASNSKKLYKRHSSQKEITKSIKINKQKKSGRASATGCYYSNKKEKKQRPLVVNAKNPIASARVTLSDTDPLQININLNLILDKERLRSGTPYTCTLTDKRGGKESICQVQANIISKATMVLKKELQSNRIGKVKSRKLFRNKQESMLTNEGNLIEKLKGKKNKGRGSVNPQQRRNLAINHLCKSIKNLLSPSGSALLKPGLKVPKSRGVGSPHGVKIKHVHRRSGTDVVQNEMKHNSMLGQETHLFPI